MNITIGETVKAQGIKGELKVKPLTDDISRFNKLKKVFINGVELTVSSVRIGDGLVYMKFSEVNDRNGAEKLVGFDVEIDRSEAVTLPENSFFLADVIGAEVLLSDGTSLGKVDYVYSNGAADVFDVKGEKNVMFPFLNRLLVSVDLDNKKIIVDKTEFMRVAVYED